MPLDDAAKVVLPAKLQTGFDTGVRVPVAVARPALPTYSGPTFRAADPALLAKINVAPAPDPQALYQALVSRKSVPTTEQKAQLAAITDPAFWADAIRERGGQVLQFAPATLTRNAEFGREALLRSQDTWPFLSEGLRSNPELRRFAAQQGVLSKELMSDRSLWPEARLVSKALNGPQSASAALPEIALNDPDAAAELASHDFRLAMHLPFATDDAWLAKVAKTNPLLLFTISPERRDALFAKDPSLRDTYEQRAKTAADLGWSTRHLSRFKNEKEWKEIVANRTAPLTTAQDPRPIALVIAPSVDDAGAFAGAIDFSEMSKTFRVQYHEVSDKTEFTRAFKELGHRQADFVMINGHGRRDMISLGGRDPAGIAGAPAKPEQFLQLTDEETLKGADLSRHVRPGASVLITSCSTGEDGGDGNNIANAFGRILPQAEVIAPRAPDASMGPRFDAAGKLVSERFDPLSGGAYRHEAIGLNDTHQPIRDGAKARAIAEKYLIEFGRTYSFKAIREGTHKPQMDQTRWAFEQQVAPELKGVFDEMLQAEMKR